ncbi:MAG: sensor domain-containing protein [Mycobacterium sp.]|uniref:sensor domain-containing protein n=1 Tax=Mycobacterium sp. TaxID=1785 RepID=UPI003BB1F763
MTDEPQEAPTPPAAGRAAVPQPRTGDYPPHQQHVGAQPSELPSYGQPSEGIAVTTHIFGFETKFITPKIFVDGDEMPAIRWGRTVVPARPGQHHVHVHLPRPWLSWPAPRQIGPADTVVEVDPGRLVELEYRAPVWQWSPGSLGAAPQSHNGVRIRNNVNLLGAPLIIMMLTNRWLAWPLWSVVLAVGMVAVQVVVIFWRPGARIAAIVAILAAVVGLTVIYHSGARRSSTTSQPSTTVTPVASAALEGLLLSPDQINTAMGATGITVKRNIAAMLDDASAHVPDKACLPLLFPAQPAVYEGSGWTGVHGQGLSEPGGILNHRVFQFVVLFSSAHDAGAFFTASDQRWSACANRQLTFTAAGQPDQVRTVGPVSNTNGTLSATTQPLGGGNDLLTCQRALTVANNVAIDVSVCSHSQSDAAVNIAHQIAAKVPI